MGWMTKKSKPQQAMEKLSDERSSIEIVAHKDAKKEVVEDARKANDQLARILENNHFTLKIYLAVGGKKAKVKNGRS